mmetsp:Transcript_78743/g.182677  ORF Transcript_78743/g.182677 Transcript_78743/m.182677 type:complete len:192 (-) Transcript_78743:471-1046(-)
MQGPGCQDLVVEELHLGGLTSGEGELEPDCEEKPGLEGYPRERRWQERRCHERRGDTAGLLVDTDNEGLRGLLVETSPTLYRIGCTSPCCAGWQHPSPAEPSGEGSGVNRGTLLADIKHTEADELLLLLSSVDVDLPLLLVTGDGDRLPNPTRGETLGSGPIEKPTPTSSLAEQETTDRTSETSEVERMLP